MHKKLFTSESVGRGHPDKICDQISDRILDQVLKNDPKARVAIETMASNHLVIVGGELTTTTYVDVVKEAWYVLKKIGYTENDFTIISNVNSQSPDIAQGVDGGNDTLGAGDQGLMFGYATNETANYMPLALSVSHELVKRAELLRKTNQLKTIKADVKSQVTVDYTEKITKIDTILMSIQHIDGISQESLRKDVLNKIVIPVIESFNLNKDFKFLFNPTGNFVIGGPFGDTGLTGRKIIVDTYGGYAHHGGGAFSGKDYTKVDRSAAYAARWVAKNIVAAGLCDELEIQVSYAIGVDKPVSIGISKISGQNEINEEMILNIIDQCFDLSPSGIINSLDLPHTKYYKTSFFGHFGREDLDVPWERLNKVEEINQVYNKLKNK